MRRNKDKPVDVTKLVLKHPLREYRIYHTDCDSEPMYVKANSVELYNRSLEFQHVYTEGHYVTVLAFGENEWSRVELVSEFPEET